MRARESEVTIRPVRPDEHAATGEIVLAAYDAVGRMSDAYREQLRDTAARSDAESTVLVAIADDVVVGTVTVVTSCSAHFELAGHADGGLRALAVSPDAQGRGIGRLLVEHVLDLAGTAQWRRIGLTTMAFMEGAQRLYRDLGFTRRPDLDVRYPAGVGHVYVRDLLPSATAAFPPPRPVPDEPPWYEHVEDERAGRSTTGC